MNFRLRYAFLFPGVNSRAELVPSHGASRCWLGDYVYMHVYTDQRLREVTSYKEFRVLLNYHLGSKKTHHIDIYFLSNHFCMSILQPQRRYLHFDSQNHNQLQKIKMWSNVKINSDFNNQYLKIFCWNMSGKFPVASRMTTNLDLIT